MRQVRVNNVSSGGDRETRSSSDRETDGRTDGRTTTRLQQCLRPPGDASQPRSRKRRKKQLRKKSAGRLSSSDQRPSSASSRADSSCRKDTVEGERTVTEIATDVSSIARAAALFLASAAPASDQRRAGTTQRNVFSGYSMQKCESAKTTMYNMPISRV